MKTISRLLAACSGFAVMGLFVGCSLPQPQADTVRYFTLSGPVLGETQPVTANIRLVRLAGHLRNRAMAVRVSEHEVIYIEDVRWAEPLDEAITQVLRNRLGSLDSGISVMIQVLRCELVRPEGNTLQFSATYTLTGASGVVKSGSFTATPQTWDGRDYGNLVGMIRTAVTELAEAVSAADRK